MKSVNPKNEYIPLDLKISVRRDTLRLISEMARDMGISINEVFSFLAEDSVIDLELIENLNNVEIPNKCSLDDLKNEMLKKKLSFNHFSLKIIQTTFIWNFYII